MQLIQLREQFNHCGNKMVELHQYAMPGNYNEEKAKEYYTYQRKYNDLREQINDYLDSQPKKQVIEQAKVFVNADGEATTRTITTSSYSKQQRKISKQMMSFVGGK